MALVKFAPFQVISLICILAFQAVAAPAESNSSALTNWLSAQTTFQNIGEQVAQNKLSKARTALMVASTNLPSSYGQLASQFVPQLDALSKEKDKEERLRMTVDLCAKLQDYKDAVKIGTGKAAAETDDDELVSPWFFIETGETTNAIAAIERKLAHEDVELWQEYLTNQIVLLQKRAARPTHVATRLEFVREHYLKGYEQKADFFGALRELNRALPFASGSEAVTTHQLIIQCLGGLQDDAGVFAWEEKLLRDFAMFREACAQIYVDRGVRAYHQKRDLTGSMENFRKVSDEYQDTEAWGDAQYSIGLLLQEEKKCDEAIAALEKIFPSHLNDYKLEVNSKEDCKNYRFKAALRISECYRSKTNYVKALEYAQLARDKYKFFSFCKTCEHNTRAGTDDRVKELQQLVEQAKAEQGK